MSRFKVICIDDDFSNVSCKALRNIIFPKFGHTYTVRKIDQNFGGGYLLEEIINPEFVFVKLGGLKLEPGFATRRFVPLEADEVETEFVNVLEMIV